jgi:hypothetical protein
MPGANMDLPKAASGREFPPSSMEIAHRKDFAIPPNRT